MGFDEIIKKEDNWLGNIEKNEQVEVNYFDVLFKPNSKSKKVFGNIGFQESKHLLENNTKERISFESQNLIDSKKTIGNFLEIPEKSLAIRKSIDDEVIFAMGIKATEIFRSEDQRDKNSNEILPINDVDKEFKRTLEILWCVPLVIGKYSRMSIYEQQREYYMPEYIRYKPNLTEGRIPGTMNSFLKE